MPTNWSSPMAGRSSTRTTSTSPSASMRTSLKNPVSKSLRTASSACSWVMRSPTFTGR